MFSGQKGFHALNIFKWKQHSASSLTAELLNDAPHEIELSDYHRAPSPGSESPSGLLDGETLNAEPIDDLDLFFEKIYTYYCEKGLWCIIIKWMFELLSLAFTICFSGFFLLFVDWNGLRNAKCGMDAVESGIKPCDLSEEALHKHPLTPFTLSKAIIVGYLGIFSIYCIFCFLRFFAQLKETLKIRRFYYNSLHVTDNEIQTMPWSLILEKVVQLQRTQQLCVVKDLSVHDVVMRLMRKENYLIGMINKEVLAFPISQWIPGSCATGNVGPDGVQLRLVLPKTLEWTLNWCILQSMFDRNFCVRRDFVSDPNTLKKRLMIVGFALLLLSPFLVIFMLVYLFLRHAEQFYNHPSTASSRRWSNLSKWMLREFNEVDHLFKHRINSSIVHASDYLKQFPSPILTIVAKFISFVSGGFAAVLIIIAFLEESLLEGHIFGRNLFWYAAVFGTITAISRAAMMDEILLLDPQRAMSLVVQHTHFMPKRWRGKENTGTLRLEFETLFQYTGMMLLEEMASIFLTPYLLMFVVPKRVDDILKFIKDFTVDVEGVGHVCSFSRFDFRNHGNKRYGSPFNSTREQRSSQGKMEKSFLSFQIAYPSCDPNDDGKQFLTSLKIFRDQKLRGQGTVSWQHQNPSFRGFGTSERNTNNLGNLDSMWLIDGEQKNFPYILEWYYSCQNHDETPSRHDEENPADLWKPSLLTKNTPKYEDNWDDKMFEEPAGSHNDLRKPSLLTNNSPKYEDNWDVNIFEERAGSHLEASTAVPFFQESVLQHHESNKESRHPGWWARRPALGPIQDTSFLEPPNFYGGASRDFYDNHSERSMEEHHQLELRNSMGMTGTFYMDGEFDLPFVDIYRTPSEGPDPPANLI